MFSSDGSSELATESSYTFAYCSRLLCKTCNKQPLSKRSVVCCLLPHNHLRLQLWYIFSDKLGLFITITNYPFREFGPGIVNHQHGTENSNLWVLITTASAAVKTLDNFQKRCLRKFKALNNPLIYGFHIIRQLTLSNIKNFLISKLRTQNRPNSFQAIAYN